MVARLFRTRCCGFLICWQERRTALVGPLFVFLLLIALVSTPNARGQVLRRSASIIDVSPLVAKSTVISSTDSSKQISVVLVLPLKYPREAADFAERVSTPTDPLYGKFLSPQEFAAAYGADENDYAEVKAWALANRFKISEESISRTTLTVRGTVAQFQVLFNTQINNYRSPKGDEFYSAATKPTVPVAIAAKLSGVIGLTSARHYAPHARVYKNLSESPATTAVTDTGGTGPGGAFSPADLRFLYSISLGGYAVRQTVALFEQGGFAAGDVAKYLNRFSLPKVQVKPRLVNGYGGGIDDPGVELEAVLDIDLSIGLNPAVSDVLVYEDGDDPFGVALLDSLADVANDNLAQTLSISYGLDESLQGNTQVAAEAQIFTQLAAQGISVFASAGDDGAYGDQGIGLNVSDPASQPFVTGVGGTTLYTYPNKEGQPYYEAEEAWNLLGASLGATGGGVSSYWALPTWQSIADPTSNGGSATFRNVPDVAAVANPATGVAVYSALNGGWLEIGGTSVSSPLWAAYVSLLNSGRRTMGVAKVGFFNPSLYNLRGHFFDLVDITDGSNGNVSIYGIPGYNAGVGYDNCTGWGTMNNLFAPNLLLLTTKNGRLPDAPTNVTTEVRGTTVKLAWKAAAGATGYFIYGGPTVYVSKGPSVELTGLSPKVVYFVYIAAVNNSGATPTPSFYLPPVQ